MTVSWFLAAEVHVARSGRDLVFLDVETDSYFCLARAGEALAIAAGGRVHIPDEDLAHALAKAGLLVGGPRDRPSDPCLPQARQRDLGERDLFAARRGPGWVRTAQLVARTAWDGALTVHRRPFKDLIALARSERPLDAADRRRPSRPLLTAVRAFQDALAWAPWQGECLYRSFTLLRHLRREGFDAQWVFGVRTWPFHAHCWLQAGDVVLEDTIDRLLPFSPILAV